MKGTISENIISSQGRKWEILLLKTSRATRRHFVIQRGQKPLQTYLSLMSKGIMGYQFLEIDGKVIDQ